MCPGIIYSQGIDRVSKLAIVLIVKNKTMTNAKRFLEEVLKFYPYKINDILTDNGQEFCYNSLKRKPKDKVHLFVKLCKDNKIGHTHEVWVAEQLNLNIHGQMVRWKQ